MKQSIPKKNAYIDITASELQMTALTPSEKDAVHKLIGQLNSRPLTGTCIALAVGLFSLFVTLCNIFDGDKTYGVILQEAQN